MSPLTAGVVQSEIAAKFQRFLGRFHVSKGAPFTHTSLGKPSGSFFIPVEYNTEFHKLYSDSLNEGCAELHITEKNRHIGPMKVDLDFRWPEGHVVNDNGHAYTNEDVDTIIRTYFTIIGEYFDIDALVSENCVAYVMEKPGATVTQKNIKDGIHIMFPNIVTKASVQYVIRKTAIDMLSEIFTSMKCSNPPSDIIDEAIIERNNWLMYGSRKPGGEAYVVTKLFGWDTKKKDLVPLEVPKGSLNSLVKTLSIRNKYDETITRVEKSPLINTFEEEQDKRRKKMESARNIITDKPNLTTNQCDDTELAVVRKLVAIISPSRADSYNDWIRLGWCLRNIDHRLVDAWDEFSKSSSKYVEGECTKIWSHMREGGLGVGTLHMWAKHDNLASYSEIMRTDLRNLIYQSMSATHNDIAQVIHHMYRYDYVCTSIKYKSWYEFKNHRWHSSDGAFSLRIKISSEVWREYMAASRDWAQRAMDTTSQQEQKAFQENAKRMNEIALKLKTAGFKDYVMKECSELFFKEKFEDLLDSRQNLLGFNNGVYDLDTFEFREGRPEDYVSFTTGVEYTPFDPNNEHVNAIQRYFSQVLTRPAVREYVLKLFATYLHGAVKEQKFYIWTGSGSNSKSLCVELFEKSAGDYCCKFPITLLTQKRAASNAATSELARAKGKRFACLQEPSEDEKLNIGLMKELSGGDKIMARALFKEPVEFKPQFKMLLLCNHLPHVPSDDGGTWRRIRVVEFTSKFVDTPSEPNEFPIDVELPKKMETWPPHFIALLIEYYKLYKEEGIQEPEEVVSCTREYKRNNDHLADFIHNCIEKHEGGFLSLNEAFAELKSWARDDNIKMSIPTKSELEKYMSKNIIKCVTNNNFKGFKNYRLKNRYQTAEEDDDLD